MAVHIADKVQALAGSGKGVQRQHRHLRPQVRAADADVDDVGDGAVGTHALGIGQHGVQRAVYLGQRLRLMGAGRGRVGRGAQERVPHLALLGGVDHFACKHGVAVRQQARLACQLE